jgi:hypothetical protein
MLATACFLRVGLVSTPSFNFTRARYIGLMRHLLYFAAFQSIIDNMTLSEAEITEYGGPFWSLTTTSDDPDLIHRIGYFVNYERSPNNSEHAIVLAGPCPLTCR